MINRLYSKNVIILISIALVLAAVIFFTRTQEPSVSKLDTPPPKAAPKISKQNTVKTTPQKNTPKTDTNKPINTPAIVTSKDKNDLPLNEADKALLKKWEKVRGYDLIDGFMPYRFAHKSENGHPYSQLTLDVLLGMATNGDPVAQLFYGLNIKDHNPDEAISWLKESIINGGYSGPMNHISTLHSNKIMMSDLHKNRHEVNVANPSGISDEERLHNTKEAYKWAIISKMRNDVYADQLLATTLYNKLSAEQRQQLEQEAKSLYQQLNTERMIRGHPGFNNDPLPDRITSIFNEPDIDHEQDEQQSVGDS